MGEYDEKLSALEAERRWDADGVDGGDGDGEGLALKLGDVAAQSAEDLLPLPGAAESAAGAEPSAALKAHAGYPDLLKKINYYQSQLSSDAEAGSSAAWEQLSTSDHGVCVLKRQVQKEGAPPGEMIDQVKTVGVAPGVT